MYGLTPAVHHMYMAKRVTTRFKPTAVRRTFLRQWREYKEKTLEDAAAHVGITHASLSRIERGLQPYKQPILEGLADYYGTDAGSLIMRDPSDPDGIWSVWEQAKPGERKTIVEVAKTLVKSAS